MSSSLGESTASTIVTADTYALISLADEIVRDCKGVNCNTSLATQTAIKQQLSTLSQQLSSDTLYELSVPTSSTTGRKIYNAYLDLGSAVASVYSFQCGATTVNSTSCVSNADAVKTAQKNLRDLLVEPATNEVNHAISLSILAVIGLICLVLFIIFMIIGYVEYISTPTIYITQLQQRPALQQPEPQVAVPASPFDTKEPVYK